MQISEIIRALDLLGTVHLNKEKSKPNAAILKVRALIYGGDGLTLSEWIERNQIPSTSNENRRKVNLSEVQIQQIAQTLKDIRVEEIVFDKTINGLDLRNLSSSSWQRLSLEYSGKRANSSVRARANIVEHFAASVRLAKRRSMLENPD